MWKIEEEKDREKEKVRRQASEAQREKELERDTQNKGDVFCGRNNMKFCSGGEKMINASGHLGENERQWKKSEQESFWKFHVVFVQNNGKEMYKESVLHVQSCFFAN